MPGWHGRAPRRRQGIVVLVAIAVALWAFIALLGLLVPATRPLGRDLVAAEAEASCDDPQRGGAPVLVTSGTLLGCPEAFDGRLVVVVGEAIGDLFDGPGDRRWVQVNDDAYAAHGPLGTHNQTLGTNSGIAVLLPPGEVPDVLGGPGRRGDVLSVVGTYEATSAADQGGPAVIAQTVVQRAQGGPAAPLPHGRLRGTAAVALVAVLALVGAVVHRRSTLTR